MKPFLSACLSAGLLVAGLGLTGCQSSAPEVAIDNPAEPIEILERGHGDDAGLVFADAYLVKNERQLKAIGAESLGDLEVDYKNNALIVLALGKQNTGGYGALIDSVQVEGGTLVVNAYLHGPSQDGVVTQAITHPYAFAVIPDVVAFDVVVNELQ